MSKYFNSKSTNEELRVTIKSRLLCYESSEKLYKCLDCGAALTDNLEYLNSRSLVELYEPNDKRDWVFAYCELLAKYPDIETKKQLSLHNQLIKEPPQDLDSLPELQAFRELYREEEKHRKDKEIAYKAEKGNTNEDDGLINTWGGNSASDKNFRSEKQFMFEDLFLGAVAKITGRYKHIQQQ